jgi:AraC-like DNA-binding protein
MDAKAFSHLRLLPLKSVSVFRRERRIPLHAMISSGGHSMESSTDYSWDGAERGTASFAVLQLTLAGRGRLDARAGSSDLTPGTLMIVDIPSPHRYYLPEASSHWEFVFLVVYGSELMRIVSGIERRMANMIPVSEESRIPSEFHRILKILFSQRSLDAFENSALAYSLCMALLKESYAVPARQDAPRFEAVKKHLHDNLQSGIGVSEMANKAGLSRSHFARLFKETEGMSPRDYVEDLRLRRALSLLYSQSLSVKEIAISCGIPDVNYFCRLFRRHTGMSPGEYRRSAL